MNNSLRTRTLTLGLIGSVLGLFYVGVLAVLYLDSRTYFTSDEQAFLVFYLIAILLAFVGSTLSYFRPKIGGTILLVAGGSPIALQLFYLILAIATPTFDLLKAMGFLAAEFSWPSLLLIAGVLALVKRNL